METRAKKWITIHEYAKRERKVIIFPLPELVDATFRKECYFYRALRSEFFKFDVTFRKECYFYRALRSDRAFSDPLLNRKWNEN